MAQETRTTITAAWAAFFRHMEQLAGSTGSGSTLPMRIVHDGEVPLMGLVAPYLTITVLSAESVGKVDADKQWLVTVKFQIVSYITAEGLANTEILSKIAQTEDRIESFAKPAGVSGLEKITWTITRGTTADHGDAVIADAVSEFTVVTSRGRNI